MEHLTIKEIRYASSEYEKEVALRDKILRKPLGLSLYAENLEKEKEDSHIGAYLNGELIGVLILTRLSVNKYKMRQVAVDDAYQGKGAGKKLVQFAETYARDKGAAEIILNARKSAIDFYERLGYQTRGEEFTEVTIPHKKMIKKL